MRPVELAGVQLVHAKIVRVATAADPGYRAHANTRQWVCACDCGRVFVRSSQTLRVNSKTHCGCLKKLYLRGPIKHGESNAKGRTPSLRYSMLKAAAQRARRKQLDFNLKLADIVVPSHCPVLGIPLHKNANVAGPNSPSLDRIDNDKGYVVGNVAVISKKANNIKSNATVEELEAVAAWLRKVTSK